MTAIRPAMALVALLLSLSGVAASAQKIDPGLWEHTVTMKGEQMAAAMAQLQAQLAQMSPEQRRQVEAMMGGPGMGLAAGKPTAVRVCVTPEQAARDDVMPPDSQCRIIGKERSGNTLRMTFACSGERQGSGEGEFTIDSAKAHHGRMVIDHVDKGRPMRLEMEMSARWLAADCGKVKPVGP